MGNLDRSHKSCCTGRPIPRPVPAAGNRFEKTPSASAGKIPTDTAVCPRCGKRGRKVGAVTLDHHLPPIPRSRFRDSAGFCPNPDCEMVYFNGEAVALKDETALPVTQKDSGDGVHVCYCFNFKRADIRRDLVERGSTDVPDKIKQGIAEGRCGCETMNPQGACCLGNVAAEVEKIRKEVKSHA